MMYKCKDRREDSADVPSSVGWFGGDVKGENADTEKLYNKIKLLTGR